MVRRAVYDDAPDVGDWWCLHRRLNRLFVRRVGAAAATLPGEHTLTSPC